MRSLRSWGIASIIIVCGALIGWWLGQSATQTTTSAPAIEARDRPTQGNVGNQRSRVPKVQRKSTSQTSYDDEAIEAGALQGQRWLRFSDRESMERFLSSIESSGTTVLGRIDALNTLRLQFSDSSALAGLLDGTEDSGFIFPVTVPDVGSVQEGAVGFGRSLLSWLGIENPNPEIGRGVSVAVLDTGVGEHSAFKGEVRRSNLIELPGDLSELNGHGTAVASLISSELGLAPGAPLLSIRVADDNGFSNSFTLAQGVIDAADAGVNIINISMGSSGDSTILRTAIEYAQNTGALIVASAGNEGSSSVAYPAAYEGVVAVGAVDANGNHLNFSNSGDVTLSAPGLSVYSAYPNNQQVLFTGTSSSAPVVSGAIAYVMDTQNVSAQQALNMLSQYSNDAGAPGNDPALGQGYIDLGRINRLGDPSFTDAAIASNHVKEGANGSVLQLTVQNRGNTTLINAPVRVATPTGVMSLNVASLPAGKSQTFELPLNTGGALQGQGIQIDSNVSLSSGGTDSKPSNNRRVDVHIPADVP